MSSTAFWIQVLIMLAGFAFLIFSSVRWAKQPVPARVREEEGERDPVRGFLFGLWLIALPLFFLIRWYVSPPTDADLPRFQYDHRAWSDLWAALSVALGVLFGLKKW